MTIASKCAKSAIAVAALLAAGLASATTYSAANNGSEIDYFGYPDTTSYGETFNLASAGTLQDWTFYTNRGNAGNLQLVVASWDGSKAVGPALYTSSTFAYAGGAQTLFFGGIDTVLGTGSYIAYVTTAGLGGAASSVGFAGSTDDGGLGGAFRYLNSSGADPLSLSQAWDSYFVADMAYTANFGAVAAVPEPETYAMLMAGLGLLGAVARRRKRAA